VFLAGGIGITPFRSILFRAAKEKLPHRIILFGSSAESVGKKRDEMMVSPNINRYWGDMLIPLTQVAVIRHVAPGLPEKLTEWRWRFAKPQVFWGCRWRLSGRPLGSPARFSRARRSKSDNLSQRDKHLGRKEHPLKSRSWKTGYGSAL
jgi:hypothetical protein